MGETFFITGKHFHVLHISLNPTALNPKSLNPKTLNARSLRDLSSTLLAPVFGQVVDDCNLSEKELASRILLPQQVSTVLGYC